VNLAADNARDLLAAAKTLATGGVFGPATSLLVLALEEAQKARLLIALATGKADVRLSDDVASDITSRDHTLRHHGAFTASISHTTLAKIVKPSRRNTPLERKLYDADIAALGWLMKAKLTKTAWTLCRLRRESMEQPTGDPRFRV
jgi:AbiV family abortive infection protein